RGEARYEVAVGIQQHAGIARAVAQEKELARVQEAHLLRHNGSYRGMDQIQLGSPGVFVELLEVVVAVHPENREIVLQRPVPQAAGTEGGLEFGGSAKASDELGPDAPAQEIQGSQGRTQT